MEIVKLIGGDVLPDDQKLTLEIARVIRLGFLQQNANDIKKANRILSRKKKGSNHRRLAKIALARLHKKIANQRKDFQFKLANDICKKYALICIEDLNIKGMQKR